MATRTLTIELVGDGTSAQKAMQDVGAAGEQLEAKVGGLPGMFGSIASTAGGFLAAQAIQQGPAALMSLSDTARDLELQLAKTEIVFGDSTGTVRDWAAENAASMGLTKNEAANLATGLGDLLIPMGFTREAAAEMATQTIGLSGALAEWSGGQYDAAQTAEILQKAYLGETDGLKALGISISAAEVEARLLEKGQKDLTGEALAQAKALAIQELVFEKSTDAQTAFANGADTAARKQAEMRAKMNEAKETLALALAPAIQGVTTLLATAAVPAFEAVGAVIGGVGSAVNAVIPYLSGFGQVFTALEPFLLPAVAGIAAVGAVIMASMVPAVVAWAAAEVAKTAALLASAAAFIVANAPLIAIAAGIGLLVAAVVLLVQHWDTVTEKVPLLGSAFDGVKSVVTDGLIPGLDALWGFFTGSLLPIIQEAIDLYLLPLEVAFEAAKAGADVFKTGLDAVWGFITGSVIPAFTTIVETLDGPLTTALGAAKAVVTDVFIPGLQRLWDFFNGTLLPIIQSAIDLYLVPLKLAFDGVKSVVADVLVPALTTLSGFVGDTLIPKLGELADYLEGGFDVAMGIASTAVGTLAGGFEAVRDAAQWVIDKLDAVAEKINSLPSPPGWLTGGINVVTEFGKGFIPGRASGGEASGWTIVGEDGPELAKFPSGSHVFSNEASRRMLGAGGGAVVAPIHIHVHGSYYGDVGELARRLDLELKRSGRLGLAGARA